MGRNTDERNILDSQEIKETDRNRGRKKADQDRREDNLRYRSGKGRERLTRQERKGEKGESTAINQGSTKERAKAHSRESDDES